MNKEIKVTIFDKDTGKIIKKENLTWGQISALFPEEDESNDKFDEDEYCDTPG
jgi:hypothetical protein